MKLLISILRKSEAHTWMELEKELRKSIEHLLLLINTQNHPNDDQNTSKGRGNSDGVVEDLSTSVNPLASDRKNKIELNLRGKTCVSLASGCELFMRYVTNSFSMIDQVSLYSLCVCSIFTVRHPPTYLLLSNPLISMYMYVYV